MSADVAPPAPRPKKTGLHKGEIRPGVEKVDPIIVADGVKRVFGGLTAVDVDHLEIPRHAITALIGPNGAGKTTLFNLLTGFDKPDEGRWSFDGQPLAGVLLAVFSVGTALHLTTRGMTRLKRCEAGDAPGDPCRNVVVDVTRNGRQRFCSVRCGNRAAVRRHRAAQNWPASAGRSRPGR